MDGVIYQQVTENIVFQNTKNKTSMESIYQKIIEPKGSYGKVGFFHRLCCVYKVEEDPRICVYISILLYNTV